MKSELKNIALKLTWRIALIALILVLSNAIYSRFIWENDLWKYGQMLHDVESNRDHADILYFGESSNFSYHPTRDSLEDRISDFISYYYPDLRFGTINHAAYHAGIYVPLIEHIERDCKVKTLIVTLNLRTLGQAVTHSPLETSMQQEKVLFSKYPPLVKRLFLTLNNFDNRSEIDRDKIKWQQWTNDVLKSDNDSISFPNPTIRSWCEQVKFPNENGIEDMPKRALADHYIKAYAFQVDESNPRIKDLDAIAQHCKNEGIDLIYNLLAENVEYADSLVGENLVWLMRANRDYLVQRYNTSGTVVVDNLETVEGYHFTDQNWTTEHYDQIGRQQIARNAALALKEFYPGKYRKRKIWPLPKKH